MSFDGHQTTPAAVDGVVPASAPAFSSANAAAANSLNNGAALNTFSSVRGASSDSGRGEYVQESDCRVSESAHSIIILSPVISHEYVAVATYSD